MNKTMLTAGLALLLGYAARAQDYGYLPAAAFPPVVHDADGNRVDVEGLTARQKVVVVTLSAARCAVCQEQLHRIKRRLNEVDRATVTFLVLAPGPDEELRAIKQAIGFPYPFIADPGLHIARSFGFLLGARRILPGVFVLNGDLQISWMSMGRNGWRFNDEALFRRLPTRIVI